MELLFGAAEGTSQPTWVLRLSGPVTACRVSALMAQIGINGDVRSGFGIWEKESEYAVDITTQADQDEVERLLTAIAFTFPRLRYVHVERHTPDVQYVDLNEHRDTSRSEACLARTKAALDHEPAS